MTTSDVNAILIRLASLEVTMVEKFNNLAADNVRGETVHVDHEQRIRALEAVRWKIAGIAAAAGALSGGGIVAVVSQLLA